jgi:hypothetical protein
MHCVEIPASLTDPRCARGSSHSCDDCSFYGRIEGFRKVVEVEEVEKRREELAGERGESEYSEMRGKPRDDD